MTSPSENAQRAPANLSFVVPCYNEEAALPALLARLGELASDLHRAGLVAGPPEILLVDDGSRDRTWDLIARAAGEGPVTGVRLSRNHGHQRALLAGLMTARGDLVVSLDADLQDDLAAVPKMIEAWRQGAEIVFGVRDARDTDTAFKRITARAYYGLLQRMGVDVLADHADFRLMSRKALTALANYPETNLFLRGLVPSAWPARRSTRCPRCSGSRSRGSRRSRRCRCAS
jgi:polyisoprenyl-phosphate glycosyltransferase